MGSFGRAIKLWAANQAMKLCLVATIARLWITKSKELANISRAGGIPQWGDPKVPSEQTVICLGDSLTMGLVSASWLDILAQRFPSLRFINAGINSQVSATVGARLKPLLHAYPKPAAIVILVGTNDVLGASTAKGTEAYRKINELGRNGLSHVLSEASYADHVRGMLAEVRRQSAGTRVALLTIPPITEDLNAKINDSVQRYNAILKEIAQEAEHMTPAVQLLDLHAAMVHSIEGAGSKPVPLDMRYIEWHMTKALWRHVWRGMTWDEVSQREGQTLLVDGVHLNDKAAKLVAGLVEDFVQKHVEAVV